MIRRPPRSTLSSSSAASDVYKRQVVYRGLLGDSLAHTISFEDCYFSQLQVIDSVNFAFRAQSSQTKSWVLGTLDLERDLKIKLNYGLLEKQVDGIFDTDGQLLRDEGNGELIYICLLY